MPHGIEALLDIKLPIIQAPMAGVQDSELAIAVCQAGALGSLPCAMLNAEQLQQQIGQLKAAINGPFNLNFFCHQMPEDSPAIQDKWRARLQGYFDELAIPDEQKNSAPTRMPFSHEIADVIEPFSPPIISFHFGLPEKALMNRIKGWGTKVISTATTLAEAKWLQLNGVDAIIAQGVEAGGHRGMFLTEDLSTQVGLFSLLGQLKGQIEVPIIAAGGIGDSESVQAALLLGASAVQVGTAYLLCHQSKTSQLHRDALQSERRYHSALTTLFSGKPARGIVNRVMHELGPLNPLVPPFPYGGADMAVLRQYAERMGKDDFSPLWSGQNPDACQSICATKLTYQLAENLREN
ncbi:nitronate monooxygenase [Shewanella mesophila]|uniref:NAD(P)H-dependent flavin oxidoreductase n=1 Tax=Shewanella mesophila TaxID=2864208 RepID=UPI001C660571|nr:nitronate monooxygenase [Shewanella mesophila]QYJ87599.1 nitronate monooxygenase [Shewanella mesophila]